MAVSNEKVEQVCIDAKEKMISLGIAEELVSEIEWCLGSYASDGNADGLLQKAGKALSELEAYKKDYPRKVAKKLLDDLKKIE
ncbi:MAG: hypothetical protein ACJAZM_000474 [Cyclobacteriaceae bacterium]|jgi:hypothetical protein